MVDLFALVLTHGLLALAAWRLVLRSDLDADPLPRDSDTGPHDDTDPTIDKREARVRRGRWLTP